MHNHIYMAVFLYLIDFTIGCQQLQTEMRIPAISLEHVT